MSSTFPKLTEGAINRINNKEVISNAILQVLQYKAVKSLTTDETKYRFILSDGTNMGNNFIVISQQLIESIERGDFEKFTAIQLNSYTITTKEAIDKMIILIQDMSVLMPGSRIGQKLGRIGPNTGQLSEVNTNVNQQNRNNSVENSSLGSYGSERTNNNYPSMGSTARPMSRSNVCPINAITPYFNAWNIRARVTSKATLRKYNNAKGEGSVFSFDVMDESGEIRISAFNKECDKFYNMIEPNKVYYISKGSVKSANKRFSNLQNDYEITLSQDSVIELCEDNSESLPKLRYKFVLIKDLVNVAEKSCVDIIGICKSIDDCMTITSKKTNKELKKRDIYILDKSSYEVRFTLWSDLAEQFDCAVNSVIAVKNALVGEFNGKTLSAVQNTTIQIDPEIPETNVLKNWFVREGQTVPTNQLSKTGGDNSSNDWRYLCQLNQQMISNDSGYTYSNIRAKISNVGRNPLYKACGNNGCLKKVRDNNNGFYHCDKCQTDSPTFEVRLILSLCLSDCTSEIWVTLFQDQAIKLLDISPQELHTLQENSPQEFIKVLTSKDFKQFTFKIGSKNEQFMDETRLKSVGFNFQNIDPIKHSKEMLQKIRAWNN